MKVLGKNHYDVYRIECVNTPDEILSMYVFFYFPLKTTVDLFRLGLISQMLNVNKLYCGTNFT